MHRGNTTAGTSSKQANDALKTEPCPLVRFQNSSVKLTNETGKKRITRTHKRDTDLPQTWAQQRGQVKCLRPGLFFRCYILILIRVRGRWKPSGRPSSCHFRPQVRFSVLDEQNFRFYTQEKMHRHRESSPHAKGCDCDS